MILNLKLVIYANILIEIGYLNIHISVNYK
jgi:hypothetical protein